MPIQTSGFISMANLAAEFGGTVPRSLHQFYRGGALVPNVAVNNNVPTSGAISLGQFYNAANVFAFSFAGGTNLNLRTLAVAAGWNQSAPVQATNTAAVTGAPALTINGAFPGGVNLINNSTITGNTGATGSTGTHGAAGSGGSGGFAGSGGGASGNGGPGAGGLIAVTASVACTINNNGSIIGGTGGLGGSAGTRSGGGGGGGAGGFNSNIGESGQPVPGGNGGRGFSVATGAALAGAFPFMESNSPAAGRGGAGGASGLAGAAGGGNSSGTPGGAGGSAGAAASVGGTGSQGLYISGNANVTWAATGTLSGGVA